MSTLVVKCMTLINDFLSLIYPRHCEACGNSLFKHETFICTHCRVNLPKGYGAARINNPLKSILAGRVPLHHASSLYVFEKGGKVQRLVYAVKYEQQKELAAFLGTVYTEELVKEDLLLKIDFIVPIPLHPKKLKARGFNQSEWFAEGLAQGMNKTVNTQVLERVVETSTQTKKRKYQRWQNVDGIFAIKDQEQLENKHILLVDDVVTTGATIEAAWQALKDVKGIKLSVVAIAFSNNTR